MELSNYTDLKYSPEKIGKGLRFLKNSGIALYENITFHKTGALGRQYAIPMVKAKDSSFFNTFVRPLT